MPTIKALRTVINDGEKDYPIFLGYLSAEDLERVAAVPSFTRESENYEIADNVLGDPVVDWQRPPIDGKVAEIKDRFSRSSEFMPNPVLLAVRNDALVTVAQQVINGQTTGVYDIEFTVPSTGGAKPLWILDGQHRVLGLAKSTMRGNPIPLVLLHSDTLTGYAPKQFAKIFAEVTTLATPLDGIHSDWLQFAFRLGPYSAVSTPDWRAMKAAADLCRTQQFGDPAIANPFFNSIKFNPTTDGKPAIRKGFEFTCTSLKELVRDFYYGRPNAGVPLLDSAQLAEQIALAVLALAGADSTTADKSAFFGDSKARQKYMEEGFVIGLLSHLRSKGVPASWADLLKGLGFNGANWDFTGWVRTTGGSAGTISKAIARAVFEQVFTAGELPAGVADIPTYLRGTPATITFRASDLTPSGRAKKHGYTVHEFPASGIMKLDMGPRRHFKIDALSANIGKLETRESHDVFSSRYSLSALRRGVAMPSGGGRVELMISALTYGGIQGPALTLDVSWS